MLSILMFSCSTEINGVWAVQTIGIDDQQTDTYGDDRAYIRFVSARIEVWTCAYFSDLDLAFYSETWRDCPVDGLQCLQSVEANFDGSRIEYSAEEFVPSCLGEPSANGGIDIATGAECPGPSPRPWVWPFLGHAVSEVARDGNQLTLWHEAGQEAVSEAAVELVSRPFAGLGYGDCDD